MKRGLFAAALSLGAFVSLLWAQETPKDQPKAASGTPKIKFDSTVYDFGKTSQVDRVMGTFTFQNVGNAPLKLDKPTTSCGCTVAGVKPDVLQPGEKGELSFSLNLPKTRANLQKQITVVCNDPASPRTLLTVKAEYSPLYEINPISFNVNVRKGDATNITLRVTRADGKPFALAKVKGSQSWIETKSELDPASANSTNQTMIITATVKPDGSPRYFSESITGLVEGSEQPAFTVSVFGRLTGDLTLAPESVYWPITDPEKAVTSRRIVVRSSLADKKLEIKNLTSTLKFVELEPVTKEDGKTIEILAKLASIPERATNGFIRFETNIPSQPEVRVPITLNIIPKPVPPPAPAAAKH